MFTADTHIFRQSRVHLGTAASASWKTIPSSSASNSGGAGTTMQGHVNCFIAINFYFSVFLWFFSQYHESFRLFSMKMNAINRFVEMSVDVEDTTFILQSSSQMYVMHQVFTVKLFAIAK